MRRDALVLDEMIDAAEQAHRIVLGADAETLQSDRMRRDAVLWNLTVLGEGVGQVSDDILKAYPDAPWRYAASLRNRLVHGYWSIDIEVILTTAQRDLPAFAAQLRRIREEVVAGSHGHEE